MDAFESELAEFLKLANSRSPNMVSYSDRALVVAGRVRGKARGALVKVGGGHRRELSLGVFVLAFRVLFSVQSEARAQLSAWRLQAVPSGASQVASVL
jgi:hypothetical protein